MQETKKENIILLKNEPLKSLNSDDKNYLNPEIIRFKQDLLFFKNDILKEIRLFEEKYNLKISNQNVINSEQFFEYEKKIEALTNQVNIINSKILDNSNLNEKINKFQSFQSKTENTIFSINSKIYKIQKEYEDYFNKTEKTLDDNIRYPGLIGKNGRFQNFRKFIDYILNYFKEYNEFRDEVRNVDIISLKKNINLDIIDCRNAINDGYKSTLTIILKNQRELESKLEDTLKQNKQIIKENEKKFEKLRDKIMNDFSEYQKKFANIEKNIDNKSNEKLNEIDKYKDNFLDIINNIKAELESIKKNNESKNNNNKLKNISKGINNNYIPEGIKQNIKNKCSNYDDNYDYSYLPINLKSLNYKNYIATRGGNNYILQKILQNNKNYSNRVFSSKTKNINNHIYEEENSTDLNIFEKFHNKIMNKTQKNSRFKSLYNSDGILGKKNYLYLDDNDLMRRKGQLSLTQDYLINNKESLDIFNFYLKKEENKNNDNKSINLKKRNVQKNNYSVSNIADIKIKKMTFPDFLTKRVKKNGRPNSSSSNSKIIQNRTNNIPSSARYILKEENNRKRRFFDLSKLVKNKNNRIKSARSSESAKTIDRSMENKIKENLESLLIMKINPKKRSFNNLNNLKKREKSKSSFEKKENKKDENFQIGPRQIYYKKNNHYGNDIN